jgi:hypothetical protein
VLVTAPVTLGGGGIGGGYLVLVAACGCRSADGNFEAAGA